MHYPLVCVLHSGPLKETYQGCVSGGLREGYGPLLEAFSPSSKEILATVGENLAKRRMETAILAILGPLSEIPAVCRKTSENSTLEKYKMSTGVK